MGEEDLNLGGELNPGVEDLGGAGEDAPEYSEIEQEALNLGWNPEGVEGRRNLSAEEFIDRKPLYDEIHQTKRAMKRLQESQQAMTQHLQMIQKRNNEQHIDELKRQKLEALQAEEHDRVMQIDEKIIEAATAPEFEAAPDNGAQEAFDNWEQTNTWYNADPVAKRYADALGREYVSQYGQLDERMLSRITEEVKQAFPEKFATPRNRPSPVEGDRRGVRQSKGSKYTAKDLDDNARTIMRTLVRDGTYKNEQEYIEDLVSSGYFS